MRIHAYHGTRRASAVLTEGFMPSTGGEFGPGVYLTENPDTAAFYALHVARGSEEPAILSATVTLANPYVVRKVDWIRQTEKRTPRTVQRALQRKGHDAIIGIALNDVERQIVVFDPAAIEAVSVFAMLG